MRLLIALFTLLIVLGCSSANKTAKHLSREDIITTSYGVKIPIYNASSEQREIIEQQIKIMTEKCQRSVRLFRVINASDNSHFKAATEAAHCESDGSICINANTFSPFDVNHETAHALTYRLSSSVVREWENIAGYVYGDDHYTFGDLYPTNGLLTHYASRNAWEDIAVWVEKINRFMTNNRPGIFMLLDNDPRCLQKLQFLLKWDYIDKDTYTKMEPLLK